MFESRVRWYQNQKNNQNKNKQGTALVNNRFAATSNVYRNRAYAAVLEQSKANGVLIAKRNHLQQLESLCNKRHKLEQRSLDYNKTNQQESIDDIVSAKQFNFELNQVTQEIEHLQTLCPEELWHKRVGTLKPERVASLAILNNASGNADELFSIDPERCNCGRVFRFESIIHMNVCIACKECHPVLIAAEDMQTDMKLSTTTTVTNNNTTSPTLTCLKNVLNKNNDNQTTPNKSLKSNTKLAAASITAKANQSAAYYKYLLQFAPDACELPKQLWTKLYEALASMHLFSSLRCKPVPVTKILKDNHLQMYVSHSVRITKLFNGDPVPILSHELIQRLVKRFEEIQHVAANTPSIGTKGLPGNEIVTHFFLLAENRSDLASAFTTHKTINVSQVQTQKFRMLIEKCAQTSPFSWDFDKKTRRDDVDIIIENMREIRKQEQE